MAKNNNWVIKDEKIDTSATHNKRVETATFNTFIQANAYKQLQLGTNKFSKVKVIARANGQFNVACFISIGVPNPQQITLPGRHDNDP